MHLLNERGASRRDTIFAALAAMPPSSNATRRRLEIVTREFLKSPFFSETCRFGWSDAELFGVHPVAPTVRVDPLGLVAGLAISRLSGPRLECIRPGIAIIRCASGSRLTAPRARRCETLGIVWWSCDALHEARLAVEASQEAQAA